MRRSRKAKTVPANVVCLLAPTPEARNIEVLKQRLQDLVTLLEKDPGVRVTRVAWNANGSLAVGLLVDEPDVPVDGAQLALLLPRGEPRG